MWMSREIASWWVGVAAAAESAMVTADRSVRRPSPVACVVISPNCLSVDRRVDFYLQFLPAILTS